MHLRGEFSLLQRIRRWHPHYLLRHLLDAHPDVIAYGEMFNPRRRLESVVPGTRNRERAAPGQLLRRRLWRTGHPAGRAVGFKLLYRQGVGVSAPVWPYLRASRTNASPT